MSLSLLFLDVENRGGYLPSPYQRQVSLATGANVVVLADGDSRGDQVLTVPGATSVIKLATLAGGRYVFFAVQMPSGGPVTLSFASKDYFNTMGLAVFFAAGLDISAVTASAQALPGYYDSNTTASTALAVPAGGEGLAIGMLDGNGPLTWRNGGSEFGEDNTPRTLSAASYPASATPEYAAAPYVGSSLGAVAFAPAGQTAPTSLQPNGGVQVQAATASSLAGRSALSPASGAQAQTSTAPLLTRRYAAAPGAASSSHAASAPLLSGKSSATPASSGQAQIAAAPALAGRSAVAPDQARQDHRSAEPALGSAGSVAPSDAAEPQASSTPALGGRSAANPDAAGQAHNAGSSDLAPGNSLAAASGAQAHAVSTASITSRSSIIVASASHDQAASMTSLSASGSLAVDHAVQAHAVAATSIAYRASMSPAWAGQQHAASAAMVQAGGSLVAAAGSHLHVAAPAELTVRPSLTPGAGQHVQASTGAALAIGVSVDAAVQARITTPAALLARTWLSVVSGRHPHAAAAPVIVGSSFEFTIPADRSFRVPARQRAFVVDARQRLFVVPARQRIFLIRKGTCMPSISKYPDEERQYQADWSADLNGQTIVGQIVAASTNAALIVDRVTYAGPVMKFWLKGGRAGRSDTISFRAATSGGETLEWDQTVTCE